MEPSPRTLTERSAGSNSEHWVGALTVQPCEAEHSNLLSDVVPGSRGLEGL